MGEMYKPMLRNGSGCFITLEGMDHSGKTTQAKHLLEYVKTFDIPAILVREPGSTPNSERMREMILNPGESKWELISELMMFSVARRELMAKVIVPKLNEGYVVICDRFTDSTLAYQNGGCGIPLDVVNSMISIATDDIIPDITLMFLVADIDTIIKRAELKALDRFEKVDREFKERVNYVFTKISHMYANRCMVITADASIDTVSAEIQSKLIEDDFQNPNAPLVRMARNMR